MLWLLFDPRSPAARELIANLFFVPVSAATAAMAFVASRDRRLSRQARRGWILVAAAYLAHGIGTNIWAVDDLIFHHTHRVTWLAEGASWLYYLLLLAGLLAFTRGSRSTAARAKTLLDLATVTVGAAVLVWYFMIRPRFALAGHLDGTVIRALIPSGADLAVIVVLSSLLLKGGSGAPGTAFRLLAVGLLVTILADLVYTPLALADTYRGGHPVDLLWMLGDGLVFAGIAYQIRNGGSGRSAVGDTGIERYARLPYVFVAAGLLPIILASATWRYDDRVIVYGVLLLTLLVMARQFAAMSDNERLARERKLQEDRFRSLVQHASDAVIVVDAAGLVMSQSASIERLTGYPDYHGIGLPLSSNAHPADVEKVNAFVAEARESGSSGAGQWRVCHRGGQWVQMETVATNLLRDPAVNGIVLNSRDVSERVALESQLLQAQKMEAVGRLAGGIAHDFNNLLTAIRMTATLVIDGLPKRSPLASELHEIERSVDRGAALTRQLLAFSRRELLQPTLSDVAEVVAGIEPMLRRLIAKDMTLDLHAPLQPWRVLVDRGQLEQVIMNLALNARDAMDEHGTLAISVGVVSVDEATARAKPGLLPRDYVMITISDTGHGMTPEVQSHIFEPFFTTKGVGEGTGLGLSTVYAIVQRCGGAVFAESREGEGATFTVYLPRAAADAEAVRATPAAPDSTGGHEMILVVDDEGTVRVAVRRILQKFGYAVIEAPDGAAALETLAVHGSRISLLLTDMVMPLMGGRELIEHASMMFPMLRIAVMSGYTEDNALRQGHLAGEHAFISKPFTVEDLMATVRRVLDGTHDRRAAPPSTPLLAPVA
jgi:PAS domain S-box-containing protein